MKIGQKLSFWTISILVTISTLSAYFFYHIEFRAETDKLVLFSKITAQVIEEGLDDFMFARDDAGLNRRLADIKGDAKTISRIWLIDNNNVVQAGTEPDLIHKRLDYKDARCKGCHGRTDRWTFIEGSSIFRWVQPVHNKPKCWSCHDRSAKYNGVIVVDFSVGEVMRHVKYEILAGVSVVLCAIFLVGASTLFLTHTQVSKRLQGLMKRVNRIKEGAYDAGIPSEGSDEISGLENDFNAMARSIAERDRDKDLLFEQMARAHSHWQNTFDSITDMIAVLDEDLSVLKSNDALVAFFGLTKESVASVNFSHLLFGTEPPQGCFDRTVPTTIDVLPSVKGRFLRVNTFPYSLPEATFQGLIVIARDVTEEKEREDALREQLHFLNVLINAIPSPIFYKDADGFYLGCNKAFGEFIGKSESEIVGMTVYDLAPRALAEVYAESDRSLFMHPGLQVYESSVLGADGSTREVIFYKATFSRSDGSVAGLVGTILDITEKKKTEDDRNRLIAELQGALDRISLSQKEWRDTFDSIMDLISIHDTDFRIIRCNRAFAEYFGLSPRNVIGNKCYELFHGLAGPVTGCPHKKALDDNMPVTSEVSDPRTKKIFTVSTFPYFSPEGDLIGTIHIARDITENKEREMRLIMNERLASLGQMASGIAHEINNPLAAIAGCAEGLLSRVRAGRFDPELFVSYLSIIEEEILRCKGITTSMLSFVRKATYETRSLDLNGILDKTIEIVGFQGRLRNVSVVRRYQEDLPLIRGNEGELRQVFLIIVMNALDAMNERGTLTVETGLVDGAVFVHIGDSGNGIAPEHLTRIFDPFFTTKSASGGTGLGLSIASRIVTNHNGSVDVVSVLNEGTTFTVRLPV